LDHGRRDEYSLLYDDQGRTGGTNVRDTMDVTGIIC
jgi:hypothetical protein